MTREVWYDKEKAPRLYAGWRAMLEVLAGAGGEEWFARVLVEMQATGLSYVTCRNILKDARSVKHWIELTGSRKEDTVKVILTDAGRAML